MILSILKYLGLYVFVLLVQIFIINNLFISSSYGFLFQPQMLIMFLLLLPTNMSHVAIILVSFAAGFIYDVFLVCYGVHAAVSTLVGYIRYYATKEVDTVIGAREEDNQIWTSKKGKSWKWTYFITFIALYHLVYLLLESNGGNFLTRTLPAFISSTVFSFILVLIFENLLYKPVKN
ncbi:MAG TPA: rod shape-determining protein MreD [Bacteroidia bacterium]